MTLQPYLKSRQILQCPSEPRAGNATGTPNHDWETTPTAANRDYTDYYANSLIARDGSIGGVSAAKLVSSANTVLMGDGSTSASVWNGPRGEPWYNRADTDVSEWGAEGGTIGQERHLGGANYAFADGHVKWLKAEKVLPGNACTNGTNSPTGSNSTFCID
jgi:prepilin-type processing-associated H-X9-DG protein